MSVNMSKNKKKPVQRGNTRQVCMICMCEPEEILILHRTRRQVHAMCASCASQFITNMLQVKINTKDYAIPPQITCSGNPYGERRNKCRHVLNITQEKYGRLEGVNELLTRIFLLSDPDAVSCPSTTCGNIFIAPQETVGWGSIVNEVKCHGCDTTFCRACRTTPHHFGMSCQQWKDYSANTKEGKEMDALERAGVLRKCPRCGHGVVKLENDPGCNKMTCEHEINGVRCNETWCWLCGDAGIKYDHFYKGGKCAQKLFLGVNTNEPVPHHENEHWGDPAPLPDLPAHDDIADAYTEEDEFPLDPNVVPPIDDRVEIQRNMMAMLADNVIFGRWD